jgi:predicted membrane channel-forming protein YqfA (hemolysin III family)
MPTLILLSRSRYLPFYVSMFVCLLCSASFHTMADCCQAAASCWNKCDYMGITILIYGSMFPSFHFIFYCDVQWRNIYLGMMTALALGCSVLVLMPFFSAEKWQTLRAIMFAMYGCMAFVPIVHFDNAQLSWYSSHPGWRAADARQWQQQQQQQQRVLGGGDEPAAPDGPMLPVSEEVFWQWFWCFKGMAVSYLGGALIYAVRANVTVRCVTCQRNGRCVTCQRDGPLRNVPT